MASFDNTYSRFVAMAKIVLPLVALGLLSTVFLFSRKIDPEASIPYARVDVEELVREKRINEPDYAVVTDEGTAISFSAQSATPKPDDDSKIDAFTVTTNLQFQDGGTADITSDFAALDTKGSAADLAGSVHIVTSDGYVLDTENLTANLEETAFFAPGEVQMTGPLGDLTAGSMEMTTDDTGGYVLVFKNRVKLVYEPKE